jgi:transcriptional regulator with XRE-family HTH domain
MTMTRAQLGDTIRSAREAKGLSLREAARRIGIDPGYYTNIESGRYALGKYAAPVAKLYGLRAGELEALAAPSLPDLRPYLRARYDLDDEAIAELEQHFAEVSKQGKAKKRRTS